GKNGKRSLGARPRFGHLAGHPSGKRKNHGWTQISGLGPSRGAAPLALDASVSIGVPLWFKKRWARAQTDRPRRRGKPRLGTCPGPPRRPCPFLAQIINRFLESGKSAAGLQDGLFAVGSDAD